MDNTKHYTELEHVEKMVLAKAINFPETREELSIEPHFFENEYHQAIYQRLIDEKDIDKLELMNEAVRKHDIYGGYDFISDIVDYPVATKHNIVGDQISVFQAYSKREVTRLAKEYADNPNEISRYALQKTMEEHDRFTIEEQDSKEETALKFMDMMSGVRRPHIIKSGFESLDNIIKGFEMQQFNILAARPSLGKTALALQLSQNLVKNGAHVEFVSLETTELNIMSRMLASMTKIDLFKFKDPYRFMSSSEAELVNTALDEYMKMDIKITETGGQTPNSIKKIVNGLDKEKPNFIIIDFLSLMKSDSKSNNRNEEMGDISRELKLIVQNNENVNILALSQLNRGTEHRQDKRPVMSDIRDSGNIEQNANVIMMLYRDDYYDKSEEVDDDKSDIEVIVDKNKDGPTGTAILEFYKKIQKFY